VTVSEAARRHDEELASLKGEWSTYMRLTASVAVLVLVCGSPVAHTQQVQPAHVPQPVRERLSGLVPAPPPAGATALGQPAFYSSSALYKYMDGGADAFQAYGVQALFHRQFQTGRVDVTVDIFDMGTLENAFGMYAAERSPKREYLTIGAEGYRGRGTLNFFQGRYYVKLLGNGEGVDAALQQFATAISGKIGGGRAFPAVLAMLPDARRKPRTERYFRTDPLGHAFLSPAIQVVYGLDTGEATIMVSLGSNRADAASRLKSLEDHFHRTGQWVPAPDFGSGAARGSNSFEGPLVAAARGRYVLILLNPSAGSAGLFRDTAARLR
jgi:hypothetical protein